MEGGTKQSCVRGVAGIRLRRRPALPRVGAGHTNSWQITAMRARLDATDWRILKELQADGRITNVALAARVGLTPPPCLRRLQALEQAGLIKGYHAVVDAQSLGFEVTAFAMVRLVAQAEADLRAFENLVLTWPLVREAHMLSGDIDYMLKCVAPDLTSFQEFVLRELTAAPNVASVKTTVTIREAKLEAGVPIRGTPDE
jgi:DNA-binding Lrp family transcriptional regulator